MKIREVFNKRRITRVILASLAFLTLVSTSLVGPSANPKVARADDSLPRFNYMTGDDKTFQVANVTRGDTTYSDTLSANIGDELLFKIYFHNGVQNTTAHNTTARADLPNTEGTTLTADGHVWAENAPYGSGRNADGTVTLNFPSVGRIEYMTGTSYLARHADDNGNYYTDANGNVIWKNFPIGDSVINGGYNMGDVHGCWPYAGYVFFRAKVAGHANAVISKNVAHPGDTTWATQISANRGENVVYRIGVQNTGNMAATNLLIKDVLPLHVTYVVGTTKIQTNAQPAGYKGADTLFTTGGLTLPSLAAGEGLWVYYTATVASTLPDGNWDLSNLALVFMGGIKQGEAIAVVHATGFTSNPGLTISKGVFAGGSVVKDTNVNLDATVMYQIIVANTGNTTLNNIVVRDILPLYGNYILGSTKIDNQPASDALVSPAGISLGNFVTNQSMTITFQVKLVGCPPIGNYSVVNTAYAKADGIIEKNDSATLHVLVAAPTIPAVK